MPYSPQPYTLDRVVRLVISTAVVIGLLTLIYRLSDVLVPFFIAVFLVYLINPFVVWIQRLFRFKRRIWAVVVTLSLVVMAIASFFIWVVPKFIDEMINVGILVTAYAETIDYNGLIPGNLEAYLKEFIQNHRIVDYLNPQNLSNLLNKTFSHLWSLMVGSYHVLTALGAAAIVLLYVVFLLLDFEQLQRKWPRLVPVKYRGLAEEVVNDLEKGMHTYFRMQGLIAFIVGVLFAVGFVIIGLPMGFFMGLFLGLLNLVPYLQLVGLIPALFLSLLSAIDTGHTFWHEAFMMLLVVSIVQLFQDLYLTPKIMGKAYGLNPAVMLLSLSVWGSLLGFIGLLLALPLTTILVSYYKRFVLHQPDARSVILTPMEDAMEKASGAEVSNEK